MYTPGYEIHDPGHLL